MSGFDPNAPAGINTGIFGLPYAAEEAELVLIPVPWDVTVSYAAGTAKGPAAIKEASAQVDLFLKDIPQAWNRKIAMEKEDSLIRKKNKKLRRLAEKYIHTLIERPEQIKTADFHFMLNDINNGGQDLNQWLEKKARHYLDQGKMVAVIGGDHSTPYGLIKALGEKHGKIDILQFDAHCDLRAAYEGFAWSHASIMYNAMRLKQVNKLVQIGIRDWCEEENEYIKKSRGKVTAFFDEDLKTNLYYGNSWDSISDQVIDQLGDKVYISFDIDGLDPKLCPHTGTPVPGGLEFMEAVSLVKKLVKRGKQIVGFDVVEVAPGKDEWDANVGARLIWQLSHQALLSKEQSGVKTSNKRPVQIPKPKRPKIK